MLYNGAVPRKIRDIIADLRKNGFSHEKGRGKGSHRVFTDPTTGIQAVIPGKDGDDAKSYLEKHVKAKIDEARAKRGA